MPQHLELGLDTFGDVTADPDGGLLPQAQVIRDVIDEAVLADGSASISSASGNITGRTSRSPHPRSCSRPSPAAPARIRLGSAVTVLSSDDPIRVYQRFATLDAASDGRAEIIVGRGSFTESFPLFGYELSQYEALFEEKLDLLAALIRQNAVTWNGKTRPPLTNQPVSSPDRGRPAQDLDRGRRKPGIRRPRRPLRHAADARHHRRRSDAVRARMSISTIAPSPSSANRRSRSASTRRDMSPTPTRRLGRSFGPPIKQMHDRIGAERGWPPMGRAAFDQEADRGSLYVGSPETVARKIAATVQARWVFPAST